MRKVIKTNEVSKEAKDTLKKRTLFALMMLAIFVPCLVLGGWFYLSLVILIIGASTYEIATAPEGLQPGMSIVNRPNRDLESL